MLVNIKLAIFLDFPFYTSEISFEAQQELLKIDLKNYNEN